MHDVIVLREIVSYYFSSLYLIFSISLEHYTSSYTNNFCRALLHVCVCVLNAFVKSISVAHTLQITSKVPNTISVLSTHNIINRLHPTDIILFFYTNQNWDFSASCTQRSKLITQ